MNYKSKVLIIYRQNRQLRNTIKYHIECYEKYSESNVFYYNIENTLPFYIKKIPWNIIIFHTTFLIARQDKNTFDKFLHKIRFIKNLTCHKVALPQDEAGGGKMLCSFFLEFKVNVIYSLLFEKKDIAKIYSKILDKVLIRNTLTAYVDENEINKYKKLHNRSKKIKFSYRTFSAKSRNGILGNMKIKIGEVFKKYLSKTNFKYDISMDINDTKHGQDWIKFLCDSEFTLGIEGGSSLYDPEYKYFKKCIKYEKENPNASFNEIMRNCFKGKDNKITAAVITPRIFEATMAKSCLILREGKFNNILKKNIHYISVKKDFSNVNKIIKSISKYDVKKIIDNCYKDLILSENYSYKKFVKDFFNDNSLKNLSKNTLTFYLYKFINKIVYRVNNLYYR